MIFCGQYYLGVAGYVFVSPLIFKSNERSEDSYIGLHDFFFQEKVLEFVHAQF